MRLRQIITIIGFCTFILWYAALNAASAYTLSRGREILLNHGLQIQAMARPTGFVDFPGVGYPNYDLWRSANFTTWNLWDWNLSPLASFSADQQWSYAYNIGNPSTKYVDVGDSYANTLMSYQYADEMPEAEFADPVRLSDMAATYAQWRQLYPNVLAYTNNSAGGGYVPPDVLANYMQVAQPDMVMFDYYPEFSFPDAYRSVWYKMMQEYRTAGLVGNDGTGTTPIPYAQYLKLYRVGYNAPLPSESYVRMQQNISWAFGYSAVTAFIYNGIGSGGWIDAVMFDTPGDSVPNVVFDYVKEANRQSRNLGSALVRLVSTDIRMIPAGLGRNTQWYWDPESQSYKGIIVDVDMGLPTLTSAWSPGTADTGGYTDYITGIMPLGNDNGASHVYSDVLIGYFEPLLDSNPGYTFVDGLCFMIVNGSPGTAFYSGDPAGDPAYNNTESYHLTFDFTGSDFDSLVRLSRDTGLVEPVPLTHLGGSQYALDLDLEGGTGDLFTFWNSNTLPLTVSGQAIIAGDANGDGLVDAKDAEALADNWLKAGGAIWYDGDFNGDGNVDEADATLLAANWGTMLGSATAPEPPTHVILISMLMVALLLPCKWKVNYIYRTLLTIGVWCVATVSAVEAGQGDMVLLEQQFRELPMEARHLIGPLFWLHGDESPQRLEMYVGKVAEGGNGCFTAESRPHSDWLGPGWYRDLAICLEAAKRHDLKMWIFDERGWPSQSVGGEVPPRYAAKRLDASAVEVQGPCTWEADGHDGGRYIATLAGRMSADGKIEGNTLVDLSPHLRAGRFSWQVPQGKWKIMTFTHAQAPLLEQTGELSVDGASKDCVDWYLQTVYQPHYDHFKADFGKTIVGFFYDEPETQGDWGTELNHVLAQRNVDWKKAYVAYKFELAGEEQTTAQYQYLDAFAETWGRTMYGGITNWCHQRGVKSIGHFMEHSRLYYRSDHCAGDMMRLQGYSDMGGIDAVFTQFLMGKREAYTPPTWQTPKLGSSISHVYGKPDDVAMVEIFGARGQDLTYSEMKWWTDHMQVSGINFMIPHSFNPRSPYDTDCPPYFYNNGYEPRWPLYRVYADYTSRLSLMLTGGRHVCPVALLFMGQSAQVGNAITPEDMTTALQDALIDCDWMPYDVFNDNCRVVGKELQLHREGYRVLIVPPVEVIPYATLLKAKEYFESGGVVIGYGFLPSKSATLGYDSEHIASLCRAVWGEKPTPGLKYCLTSPVGGRSYFLPEKPTSEELSQVFTDAGLCKTLEVLEGETSDWLHVLHRQKAGQDVFLICNQNHEGSARQFQFRAIARGVPECWDAMRNEIMAIPFRRISDDMVEFSLSLEPLETVLIVFQPKRQPRPLRIEAGDKPIHEPIPLARGQNPPISQLPPLDAERPKTTSPITAADPFRAHFTLPIDVDRASCRIYLEMEGLPDDSAAVNLNGKYVGGMIGRPLRLDITQHIKTGKNTIVIEPLAPNSARLVLYKTTEP